MGHVKAKFLHQPRRFSRRLFLRCATALGFTSAVVACSSQSPAIPIPDKDSEDGPQPAVAFLHGVASGDPYANSVVLWTRATSVENGPVSLRWMVWSDEARMQLVNSGITETDATRDYTVKIIADNLQSATHYWYGFVASDHRSPIGRTKTAPATGARVERVRFTTTSCALFSFGFFNVYGGVARQDDLDVVFCLGDYIYEYGADEVEGTAINSERTMMPPHQTVTLDDYRQRYAQYRTDNDLQAAHARHPWICTWDDHESANNSYDDGAPAHDVAVDGPWDDRKRASIQAYFEWLPVREEFNPNLGGSLARQISYGDLLDFFVLDTRLEGRDIQPERGEASGPDRMMMSAAQEQWLVSGLRNTTARWRFIPQQTMVAQLDIAPGEPFLPDSWSGYTAQRDRLLDAFGGADGGTAIENVVVLAGDIHISLTNELSKDYLNPTAYQPGISGSVGVEFVCPSVTTPLSAPLGTDDFFRAGHPHIRYSEGTSDAGHGFMVFDVTSLRVEAYYHYPISILVPTEGERVVGPLRVETGSPYVDLTSLAVATD